MPGPAPSCARRSTFRRQCACAYLRGFALNCDLIDCEHREVWGRGYRFDALFGDQAKNQDWNNLKARVLVSGAGKLAPAHIGHRDDSAGCWIVFFGIDAVDRALRVAVVEADITFHLG